MKFTFLFLITFSISNIGFSQEWFTCEDHNMFLTELIDSLETEIAFKDSIIAHQQYLIDDYKLLLFEKNELISEGVDIMMDLMLKIQALEDQLNISKTEQPTNTPRKI